MPTRSATLLFILLFVSPWLAFAAGEPAIDIQSGLRAWTRHCGYDCEVFTQLTDFNPNAPPGPAGTREVPVEIVVNGRVAATRWITADGTMRDVKADVPIERSSWVALRILPSSHTNPMFVLVDGQPVRASRPSAEWCLRAVDQCWSQKAPKIAAKERAAAEAAYEHARQTYRRILAETR